MLSREFSGMIHWLTINKIIPATPSNRFIPHVKRTVFCRRLWCESASALGLFGDLHRHHRRAHEERLLWGDGERPLVSHRIHGAAIYGNIYHQYTPVMLAYIYIYQHHGSYGYGGPSPILWARGVYQKNDMEKKTSCFCLGHLSLAAKRYWLNDT